MFATGTFGYLLGRELNRKHKRFFTVNLAFDWCYIIRCVYIIIIQGETLMEAPVPVRT